MKITHGSGYMGKTYTSCKKQKYKRESWQERLTDKWNSIFHATETKLPSQLIIQDEGFFFSNHRIGFDPHNFIEVDELPSKTKGE